MQTYQHEVYNVTTPVISNFRKECTIDGITYLSGAEAVRSLGISTSQVYRLLKRKGRTTSVSTAKKVSIEGQEFQSLTQAQSVLNIPKSTLYRRLRSDKYPTWFFGDKTRSNDYPEGE